MKISDLGNVVVLFVDSNNDNEILHKIVYDSYPNVATLRENFDELYEFIEDNVNIEELLIDILPIKDYILTYGDEEIDGERTNNES